MSACIRCGERLHLLHRGELCGKCTNLEKEEHAATLAAYESALAPLDAPLKEVLLGLDALRAELQRLRADDSRTAATQAERETFEMDALWRLAVALAPSQVMDVRLEWAMNLIGGALGATIPGESIASERWRPRFGRLELFLASCVVPTGHFSPIEPPAGFLFDPGEGVIAAVPAKRVWEVEEKEMRYEMKGVELSATDRMKVESGQLRGHEVVTRRRTVHEDGTLAITGQRLVWLTRKPPAAISYQTISRVAGTKSSVVVTTEGRDYRFDLEDSDIISKLIEKAARVGHGQVVTPPPLPEMPHADDEIESLASQARAQGAATDESIQSLRLNIILGLVTDAWLEPWRRAVKEATSSATQVTAKAAVPPRSSATSSTAPTAPARPKPSTVTDIAKSESTDADISQTTPNMGDEAVPRGEPLTVDGQFRLTLEDAHAYNAVDHPGGKLEPDGILIVLTLRIENISKEPKALSSINVRLVDADGSIYDTETGLADRQYRWLNSVLFGKHLQPKGEATGHIAFDIPRAAEPHFFRVTRGFGIGADRNGFAFMALGLFDEPAVTSNALEKGGDDGDAADSRTTSTQARDGDMPVAAGLPIHHYSDADLRNVVKWVASDGLDRTDDEFITDVMHALGFKRRGRNVSARIAAAVVTATGTR